MINDIILKTGLMGLLLLNPSMSAGADTKAVSVAVPETTGPISPIAVKRNEAPVSPQPDMKALQAEATARAHELVEALAEQPKALNLLAHVYNNQGNRDKAISYWQRAVILDPNYAEAYDAMARVAFLAEEHERAIELWHRTLTIAPRLPGVHYSLAGAFMGLGRLQEAIAALQQAIEIDPSNAQYHYMLGEAYRQLGQYADAEVSFAAALRIQPSSVKACYGLATIYLTQKNTEQARQWMERFRQLKATQIQADRDRRSQYDDMQIVHGRIAQTYTQMGLMYAQHRDLTSAEKLWTRAAELDPTQVECRRHLTQLYQYSKRPQQALSRCRELADLEPRNGAHPFNMGILFAGLGQFDAALKAFVAAQALAPEQSAIYRLLAQMYMETGRDIHQAQAYAQQAVALDPQAENYFVLGAIKARQGDNPGATKALTRACELEPNNPKYQSTLKAFLSRMQQEK